MKGEDWIAEFWSTKAPEVWYGHGWDRMAACIGRYGGLFGMTFWFEENN